MADHDHNDGSRGEEEAPRDPTPSKPVGVEDGARLRYGEQADQADADIPAARPDPSGMEPEPSSWGHLRRKQTQILAAGIAGLIAGGLLGGVTVAALTDPHHDHGPGQMWMRPGPPPPHRDLRLPQRMPPECL